MNAEISQQIALVAHGNAFLAGAIETTELSLDHPAFTGVSSLAFADVLGDEQFAHDPNTWFAQLKQAGVQRMELLISIHEVDGKEPRHVAGFANAPFKQILARRQGEATLWQSRWTMVPEQTGHNTWKVDYGLRRLQDVGPHRAQPDVHLCLDALVNALEGCVTFCKNNGLDDWAKFFHDAATFEPDETSVCLPAVGFDRDAHHLLRMGQRAWCFGGMGSWNDQTFSDPEVSADYAKVSEALFKVLLISSGAAANGYKD